MLQQYIDGLLAVFDALMTMSKEMWVVFVTVPAFMGVMVVFIARWVLKIFGILKG